ncbi:MAG: hypothetical protein KatS3mg010_0136 [Acidimicrobiia bacterium]|nr:MAG: hypothetical protein KatS3mg010_0136 [Acidimicrobiia bacterium]
MTGERDLWLLGVCHRRAPADVRAALAYDDEAAEAVLALVRRRLPDVEALVLSTCNRTEVYLAGPSQRDLAAEFLAVHGRGRDLLRANVRRGDEVVAHLVRVACGLESAVVGDAEIIGQLRRAVARATRAGTIGATLGPATEVALRAGRRARRETVLGRAGKGVAPTIVDAIAKWSAERGVAEPAVLIVGTGALGSAVCRGMRRHPARLHVTNRHSAPAARLAERTGAATVRWSEWRDRLAELDVVVFATAARQPLLSRDDVTALARTGRAPFVIDAAMPPNVDRHATGIDMWTLDSIPRTGVDRHLGPVLEAVEAIAGEAVVEWRRRTERVSTDAIIGELFSQTTRCLDAIARDLADGADRHALDAQRIVRRHVRALVDGHARRLRAWSSSSTTPSAPERVAASPVASLPSTSASSSERLPTPSLA